MACIDVGARPYSPYTVEPQTWTLVIGGDETDLHHKIGWTRLSSAERPMLLAVDGGRLLPLRRGNCQGVAALAALWGLNLAY